jgi:predicted DNA-binding transcriptional regulator YafY
VDRSDRLRALARELRAAAPGPRSAAWLADRFGISVRTVERDLETLRQSGLPISSQAGRDGGWALESGWALDRDDTQPPLSLTPAEALAVISALRAAAGSPFAEAGRSASLKILATLPADVRQREELLEARAHRSGQPAGRAGRLVAAAIEQQRVLHLVYADGQGALTERDVEPLGLLSGPNGWSLLAWCRLRHGIRGFLLARIRAARLLTEHAPGLARAELRELAGRDS